MKFRLVEEVKRADGTEVLYHNTTYKNAKNIIKSGLLQSSSRSELDSGLQFTWAVNHPYDNNRNMFDYGGCTIIFNLPKDCLYEKVNDDQFIIYDDVPKECIIGVDYMIGKEGAPVKSSNIDRFINDYGKDKVRDVLYKYHNSQITIEELKELTPQLDW